MSKSKFKLNPEAYEWIGAPPDVIQWLREGVPFKFSKTPNRCFYNNRIFDKKHELFIDQEIAELLKNGTVAESKTQPRCVLALQCVPKKGNKLRLVLDCRPVNENMITPKFSQEGISSVFDLVEKDDLMITIDLVSGFHHIPVRECDQQLLGFRWRGKYYIWKYLPFGVACAPYYFNKIVRPVVVYLRENNIRLAPLVDDFIVFLKKMLATDHKELVLQTFQELGWHVSFEKSHLDPAPEQTFVGFIVSTVGGTPWIRTLPSKIRKLRRSIVTCLKCDSISARQLARIVGQCIAMTKAIMPGKLLLRNCYSVLKNKSSWDASVQLTEGAISDLNWWLHGLRSWNSTIICNKSIEEQIVTDASSIGWGGFLRNSNLQAAGAWPKSVSYQHSNY